MSTKVFVTREQVEAARTELAVMRSARLEYDPLLEKLANARTVRHRRRIAQDVERPVGMSSEVASYKPSFIEIQDESGTTYMVDVHSLDVDNADVAEELDSVAERRKRQKREAGRKYRAEGATRRSQAEADKKAGLDFE